MKAIHLVIPACALALFATCGGGNSSPTTPITTPPTTTLPPATLADLSATVTSPTKDQRINCRNPVKIEVTLTNRAASSVRISGIQNDSRVTSGGCSGSGTFTYAPAVSSIGAGQTVTVYNAQLYEGGSGCCSGGGCSGNCMVEESISVLTSPGAVPAGTFSYRLSFDANCPECESVTASDRKRCPKRAPAP